MYAPTLLERLDSFSYTLSTRKWLGIIDLDNRALVIELLERVPLDSHR